MSEHTPRQWIVGSNFRRCKDYSCIGSDKTNAKTVLHPDGRLVITCRACGKLRTEQLRSWYEKRACRTCSFVRRVTVTLLFQSLEESWERDCDVCKLEASAARHVATARQLMAKAQKIKAKRASRT